MAENTRIHTGCDEVMVLLITEAEKKNVARSA
jgi:hypothetical protein